MNKFAKDPFVLRFQRLYLYLLSQGYVQSKTDLARKMDVARTQVSECLSGARLPTINMLTSLHEKIGVNMNFIFGKSNVFMTQDIDKMKKVKEELDNILRTNQDKIISKTLVNKKPKSVIKAVHKKESKRPDIHGKSRQFYDFLKSINFDRYYMVDYLAPSQSESGAYEEGIFFIKGEFLTENQISILADKSN